MPAFSPEDDTRLRETVAVVLGLAPDELPADASVHNTGEWTSLQHLSILAAVEEVWGRQFSMDEMASVQSLADIRALLQADGAA